MAHNFQNAWIEPKVLGRAAAGNHERVVIIGLNLVEGRIQSEIVTSLLAISLVALKIVDGGPHRIAGPLIRTDGVDHMPDHEERLEGNHHFVIFNIIANQHEEFLDSHDNRSPDVIVALLPACRAFPAKHCPLSKSGLAPLNRRPRYNSIICACGCGEIRSEEHTSEL